MTGTYKNNHIRLMRFHIALSVFYLSVAIPLSILLGRAVERGGALLKDTYLFYLFVFFIYVFWVIHLVLAVGSKKRLTWARRASEFVGVIMLMGVPIGTIIGYFLLQRTLWDEPNNNAE